jgi:hypothetical protein
MPATIYLSVTPHIQPTHTFWGEYGKRRPDRFVGPEGYDTEIDRSVSDGEIIDTYVEALGAVAKAAQTAIARRHFAGRLKEAMAEGEPVDIETTRSALWDSVSGLYQCVAELADVWNDLAARSAEAGSLRRF